MPSSPLLILIWLPTESVVHESKHISCPCHSTRHIPVKDPRVSKYTPPSAAPLGGCSPSTALSCCCDVCRCGAHLGSYEEGLKGRTDNSKKLVKHNQVGREEFTSNKLAPKLAQQLKVHLLIRHQLHGTQIPLHLHCSSCAHTV